VSDGNKWYEEYEAAFVVALLWVVGGGLSGKRKFELRLEC
jgi:hypothetical protein